MLHWGNECPESEQVPGNSGTVVAHTSDKTTSSMILERGRRFLHAHPPVFMVGIQVQVFIYHTYVLLESYALMDILPERVIQVLSCYLL